MKHQKTLQRGFILLLILGMLLSFVPALAQAEELGGEPVVGGQETPGQEQPGGSGTGNDPVPGGEIPAGQNGNENTVGENNETPSGGELNNQVENDNGGTENAPSNNTNNEENGQENAPEQTSAPTGESVTVYVSFDMNGHGQPIEPVAVTAGETVNCPDDPSEENYSFSGWYTDPDFSESYDFDTPVTGDLTLIALWRKTAENWYISDVNPVSETNPAESDKPSAVLLIGGRAPANLVASGTVDLMGGAPTWSAAAADIISVVVAEDCGAPTSIRGWFASFTALESCDLRRLDTGALSDTEGLFSGCDALKTLSLGDGFRFHGASGLSGESIWTRGGQSCTVPELESNSPAGGLGGTWERGTVVTATPTAAPEQRSRMLLGAPSLPTPTLMLSAENGTTIWPHAQSFTVSSTDAIGALSVSSSDESIATVSLEGNNVTVTPLAAGTVTVTVSSAATDTVGAGTASYTATFSPKDISASVSVSFTQARPENQSSEPEMVVKDGDTVLVRNQDYTVAFQYNMDSSVNNLKYGVATLSFIGNYAGSYVGEFRQTLFSIIYHANWSWFINSHGGLEVDANGNFARFRGVTVDGSSTFLDPRYYDAVSGSTKVTLKGEYLNALSLTNHTLRIYFEDGYAETSFSVRAHLTPTTGDNSNLTLWIVLSGVSLAALAVVAVLVMKNNKHKKRPESSGNK